MNLNKILLAALAGGIAYFLLGWLVWGIALAGMMETPSNVTKDPMLFWAMILSCLVYGFFLAYIFGRWAGIRTFVSGAKAGAVLSGLVALSYNLGMYSMTTLYSGIQVTTDVIASTIVGAIAGGIVGWVLGYEKK